MTLLDAYALVALLAEEPAAAEVEELLRGGECRVVLFNLAESVDISQRVHGIPGDEVREVLGPMFLDGVLSLIASDESAAWSAAGLSASHYGKDAQLSMADCFLLAHAIAEAEGVATADPPLAKVARKEGIEVMALPDSSGKRPK